VTGGQLPSGDRMDSRERSLELNERLIASLSASDALRDSRVEAAFRATPRHQYLPGFTLQEAYADDAVRTKTGADGTVLSSASQPAIVAIMLQQLRVMTGHNVLEVGTGTGYNAALMRHLVGPAGHVLSLDVDHDICESARANLDRAGVSGVQVERQDGAAGWPERAPYDRIIVTASAFDLSPEWLNQLRPGGRLVVPVALLEPPRPHLSASLVRDGDWLRGEWVQPCGFLPLRGGLMPESSLSAGGMEGDADEDLLRELSSLVLDAWPAGARPRAGGCRLYWPRPNFSFCLHRATSTS